MEGRCGKVERVYIRGGEGSEGGGWGWKGRGRGGEGSGEGGGGGGGGVWRYERSMNNARRNKTISLRIVNLTFTAWQNILLDQPALPGNVRLAFVAFIQIFLYMGELGNMYT